jgi:hypothetical protein
MRDVTLVLIPTEEQNRKAAAIIVNGLGDKLLRVVSNHTKDPQVMLQNLRERYASTKLSTRISLMLRFAKFLTVARPCGLGILGNFL